MKVVEWQNQWFYYLHRILNCPKCQEIQFVLIFFNNQSHISPEPHKWISFINTTVGSFFQKISEKSNHGLCSLNQNSGRLKQGKKAKNCFIQGFLLPFKRCSLSVGAAFRCFPSFFLPTAVLTTFLGISICRVVLLRENLLLCKWNYLRSFFLFCLLKFELEKKCMIFWQS